MWLHWGFFCLQNVLAENAEGNTPLHWACLNGQEQVLSHCSVASSALTNAHLLLRAKNHACTPLFEHRDSVNKQNVSCCIEVYRNIAGSPAAYEQRSKRFNRELVSFLKGPTISLLLNSAQLAKVIQSSSTLRVVIDNILTPCCLQALPNGSFAPLRRQGRTPIDEALGKPYQDRIFEIVNTFSSKVETIDEDDDPEEQEMEDAPPKYSDLKPYNKYGM